MKITEIKVITASKVFEVCLDNKKFLLELAPGRDDSRYEIIRTIAEWMYKNRDEPEKRKIPASLLIQRFPPLKKKYSKHYQQWCEYLNDNRYGEKYPFILYRITGKQKIIVSNKTARWNFANEFFKHTGKSSAKACFWLGDYKKTKVKFDLPLEEQTEELFIEYNDDYVRLLAKTEDLDFDILSGFKGFNVRPPKGRTPSEISSVYITREENKFLSRYLNEDEDILITGQMKIGKTRLIFEEIKNLRGYYVFMLQQAAFDHIDKLSVSETFNKDKRKLIWVIDDIHYLADREDKLWRMYEKFSSKLGRIIIIANLRSDKSFKSQLLKDMRIIEIKPWSKNEGNKLADLYREPRSKFAGTPFSIIGNIDAMKHLYNSSDISLNSKWVLRYLKLLYEFLQFVEYNLLEVIFYHLRKTPQTGDDFEKSITELEDAGFIERRNNLVLSWEPYLEDIIQDKDYQDFEKDMEKLISFFAENTRVEELELLRSYFFNKNEFEKSIESCKQIISIASDLQEPSFLWSGYIHWGASLLCKAEQDNNKELLAEASEKFKVATEYKKDFPEAYYGWGQSLLCLAEQEKEKSIYSQAISKFELALKYNPGFSELYFEWGLAVLGLARINNEGKLYSESFDKFGLSLKSGKNLPYTYLNWGIALMELSNLKKDKEILKEAYEKFESAVNYKKNLPEAYLNMGLCFFDISEQHSDEKFMDKAFTNFELAVKYKKDFPDAYFGWGIALLHSAEKHKDEKIYQEAFKKFKTAIKYKNDFPKAYYSWGIALLSLAERKSHKELFKEACEKFEKASKYTENLQEINLLGYPLD